MPSDLPCGDAEIHDVVAAVLAVTPLFDGEAVYDLHDREIGYGTVREARTGPAAPIAARQAAAVLRWAAGHMRLGDDERHNLHTLADEIDPREVAHGERA